jgi:hypothetical protein
VSESISTQPLVTTAPPPHRPRWGWWVAGILGGLALLIGLALLLLDPWLKRTLEKQVARQTHGQYQLHVGELHTSLWQRAIRLRGIELTPAASVADTLPRVRLSLASLHVSGVGLMALLRKKLVPIDSVVLDSLQLNVLALAKQPPPGAAKPLHQRLPLKLPGLQIGYLGLLHAQARYGPAQQPTAQFRQGNLDAHDLLISAAGAADTQRLAYAAAWQLKLAQTQARVAGHQLSLWQLDFATARHSLVLDSLRIRPPAPGRGQPGGVRVDLSLPRFALTGLHPAALQHLHHLRADSLLIDTPRLTFRPPSQPPPAIWKLLAPYARRTDVAHARLRQGYVHVVRVKHAPIIRQLNVTGTAIRIDSAAAADMRRIFYARAWRADAGRLVTTFAAPYYTASSQHLRLNTDAKTLRFEGLALTPAYSALGMNRHKGYQVPAINIKVPSLTATGVDFAALAHKGEVRIARAVAQSPLVRIASDGRGPINPHLSKVTPDEMRQLPSLVDVRRLDIRNGNLYTRYRSPLTPVVGKLSMTRFNGSFRNLSNDPRRQSGATPLTASATAYLQDQCRMQVNVAIPLLDPQGRQRVWGSFGAGHFAILNPMTVPTRLVEFKKGDVQRIRFQLRADRKQATGTMWAEYSGLQMELLGYKQGEIKKTLLKRVISKAANVLVIRDQNPRKGGRLVSGEMTSRRELRFSMFTLWRQSIISGLFHSIGLPQQLAQKLSEQKDEAPLPK